MKTKTRIIGVRVEEEFFARLDKMEKETGMEKVSRKSVSAPLNRNFASNQRPSAPFGG